MKGFRAVWFLAGLLAAPPGSAAQKTIVISDSLAGNAERLKAKKGAQWLGRIPTWRFGLCCCFEQEGVDNGKYETRLLQYGGRE